jgi:hypothetical protein
MHIYPEPESKGKERAGFIHREYAKLYEQSDKKVLHLAATHAALVKWFP